MTPFIWQYLICLVLIFGCTSAPASPMALTLEESERVHKAHDLLMRSFKATESRIARESLQLGN